jgi:hypothetical protein
VNSESKVSLSQVLLWVSICTFELVKQVRLY